MYTEGRQYFVLVQLSNKNSNLCGYEGPVNKGYKSAAPSPTP
jgi:hypothetical protein